MRDVRKRHVAQYYNCVITIGNPYKVQLTFTGKAQTITIDMA
jgi:hypothetical protein